ncbi:MAG: AMP-binding protein [Rhodocyclales bacterium]|nr:AMP-binding protein [Rhodocyclales bacterium]
MVRRPRAQPPPRADDSGPDDLCVMPYTSGTTGHPKGCMHKSTARRCTPSSPASTGST